MRGWFSWQDPGWLCVGLAPCALTGLQGCLVWQDACWLACAAHCHIDSWVRKVDREQEQQQKESRAPWQCGLLRHAHVACLLLAQLGPDLSSTESPNARPRLFLHRLNLNARAQPTHLKLAAIPRRAADAQGPPAPGNPCHQRQALLQTAGRAYCAAAARRSSQLRHEVSGRGLSTRLSQGISSCLEGCWVSLGYRCLFSFTKFCALLNNNDTRALFRQGGHIPKGDVPSRARSRLHAAFFT